MSLKGNALKPFEMFFANAAISKHKGISQVNPQHDGRTRASKSDPVNWIQTRVWPNFGQITGHEIPDSTPSPLPHPE